MPIEMADSGSITHKGFFYLQEEQTIKCNRDTIIPEALAANPSKSRFKTNWSLSTGAGYVFAKRYFEHCP